MCIAMKKDNQIRSGIDTLVHRSRKQRPLSVSFSTIEIKEYPIIAGDNPSVSKGVPITIAWDPLAETTLVTVEDYEELREHPPRTNKEMRIPSSHRAGMLLDLGVTRCEIFRVSSAAAHIRRKRRRTLATLELAPLEEFCETVKNAIKLVALGDNNTLETPVLATTTTTTTTTRQRVEPRRKKQSLRTMTSSKVAPKPFERDARKDLIACDSKWFTAR